MIQLGICGWCLDVKGVETVKRASELGFDTMQIGVHSFDDVDTLSDPDVQAQYIEASKAHNINMIGLSISVFDSFSFHHPDNEPRIWGVLTRMIDAMIAMDVDLAYCPSFEASRITSSEEMTRVADLLRRACEYIGDRSLSFATENTLDVAGHRDLLNQVNHPKLKVLVDAYNPTVFGHHASDQIRELSDVLINQIHAKDGNNHVMGSAPLGTGEGEFDKTTQAILDINYDGYVITENNYDVDAEWRVQADVATLKRLLQLT